MALTVAVMSKKGAVCTVPFSYSERVSMEKLNFYTVDLDYVNYLKKQNRTKGALAVFQTWNMEISESQNSFVG